MPTAPARIAALGLAVAASALFLSACSGSATMPSSAPSSTTQSSTFAGPSVGPAKASGEAYGCTEDILTFLPQNGFPDAVPQDPATFLLPGNVRAPVAPVCLVRDEYGGAPRSAAFFPASAGATAAIGSALTSAGYETFSPGVWIIGGDSPTSAEHAVGGGDTTIGGTPYSWFSY